MKLTHNTPATKREAYDLITALKLGAELSEAEIDSLLLYFFPPHPKQAKNAMEWVAKVVAVQDIRQYLQYIHVVKGYATGSNGHVLFHAKTDKTDGYYCPKTLLPIDYEGDYLSDSAIDRVLSKSSLKSSCIAFDDLTTGTQIFDKKPIKYYQFPNGVKVNALYIDMAVNGDKDTAFAYSNFQRLGIVGKNSFGEFAIMGLKE